MLLGVLKDVHEAERSELLQKDLGWLVEGKLSHCVENQLYELRARFIDLLNGGGDFLLDEEGKAEKDLGGDLAVKQLKLVSRVREEGMPLPGRTTLLNRSQEVLLARLQQSRDNFNHSARNALFELRTE